MTAQLETPAMCPPWCVDNHDEAERALLSRTHNGPMTHVSGVGLWLCQAEGEKIQVAADDYMALESVPAVTEQLKMWASEFLAGVRA